MKRPPVPFKLELNIGAFNIQSHTADAVALKLYDKAIAVRAAATSKVEYPFLIDLSAQLYSLAGDAFAIASNRATDDERSKHHRKQSDNCYEWARILMERVKV